jgi:tetratricopeptide (TPR) repeat protein
MPYVRTHGNQIAIVHGERDKGSGKVQQRPLFTFYSQKEAAAATGDGSAEDARYFERLLETANPQLTFDWAEIKKEIRSRVNILPEIYPLRKVRSEEGFEAALIELVRQVAISDPLNSKVGRQTLRSFRKEMSVLQRLIALRLSEVDAYVERGDSPFELDDHFCWRYEVQSHTMPLDLEEHAADLYRAGELEEAKPLFNLLTKVFPEYAEGYNYLGLIALREEQPKEAVEYFRTTIRYGRNLFPRRTKKADWSDISNRPYMRGLMNLALALNEAGQFKESLTICDQLEKECGEKGKEVAWAHRAAAYLNLQNWQEAAAASLKFSEYVPSEGFVAGYALFELGRMDEATLWFLYAALNNPHTAMILCDLPKPKPVTYTETEDHNSAVELLRSLPRFFKLQSSKSTRFFRKLVGSDVVKGLLKESIECQRKHVDNRTTGREHFDRLREIESLKFARKLSKELIGASKDAKAPLSKV